MTLTCPYCERLTEHTHRGVVECRRCKRSRVEIPHVELARRAEIAVLRAENARLRRLLELGAHDGGAPTLVDVRQLPEELAEIPPDPEGW